MAIAKQAPPTNKITGADFKQLKKSSPKARRVAKAALKSKAPGKAKAKAKIMDLPTNSGITHNIKELPGQTIKGKN